MEEKHRRFSESAGVVNADMNAAAGQTHMDKFHAAQGHGYAAEQANHLYDWLTGQDAKIVGGDNAKNGADRLVNGTLIQSKYCKNASASVAAAFENQQYRYLNADGLPMQLEVPSDQYENAVRLMEQRIAQGQVPGVSDPSQAKSVVRKGKFTYQQAVNIAKFGTVDSLLFDAANGAVLSASTFGITAVITFVQHLWQGDPLDVAVEHAAYSGIQVGGVAFISSVISAQLMRTSLPKMLAAPTEQIVQWLGPKASAQLANALRGGATIYGAAAMNNAAKLLRGNLITAVVMTLVLSGKDIQNAFRGRISGKQLFKNIATTAGGVAGGTGGVLLGQFLLLALVPNPGAIASIAVFLVGGAIGGAAGGNGVRSLVGHFIEDDAVALVKIIETAFCRLAQEYLLSQEELDIVLGDLSRALEGDTLLEMYASPDHQAFAETIVKEQIERCVRCRCRVYLPTDPEFLKGIGRLLEDATCGRGIFQAHTQTDPVEVGRRLTGRDLSPHAAEKGLYAAKQMNLAQTQAESCLQAMSVQEQAFQNKLSEIHQERGMLKRELNNLLSSNDDPAIMS